MSTTWPVFWRRQDQLAKHQLELIGWRFGANEGGSVSVADQRGHHMCHANTREAIAAIERVELEHSRKDARRCSTCGKTICAECRDEDIEHHRACGPG